MKYLFEGEMKGFIKHIAIYNFEEYLSNNNKKKSKNQIEIQNIIKNIKDHVYKTQTIEVNKDGSIVK